MYNYHILKCKTDLKRRIAVNCCNYSYGGYFYRELIVGGLDDGSLQFFDSRTCSKTIILVEKAHGIKFLTKKDMNINENGIRTYCQDNIISDIKFYEAGTKIISRGICDSSLKLWDIRNMGKPLLEKYNLNCISEKSGIFVSPDENVVCCFTSDNAGNYANFINLEDFSNVHNIKTNEEIVSGVWNVANNQIVLGGKNNKIYHYFDGNRKSAKENPVGIEKSVYKKAKVREIDERQMAQPIITQVSGEIFDDDENIDKKTLNQKLGLIPETKDFTVNLPLQGLGSKGYKHASLFQGYSKSIYLLRDPKTQDDHENSIELFNKFRGKNDFVNKAYENNKTIYETDVPTEIEVDYYKSIKTKICKACGLKICTCNKSIFK